MALYVIITFSQFRVLWIATNSHYDPFDIEIIDSEKTLHSVRAHYRATMHYEIEFPSSIVTHIPV